MNRNYSLEKPTLVNITIFPFLQKMWALCDMAHTLLMSKSLELTEVSMTPAIPSLHFREHPEPGFTNDAIYIPGELAVSTKTKTGHGMGIYVSQAASTRAAALKRVRSVAIWQLMDHFINKLFSAKLCLVVAI